ncbi:MAG: alpha/beta hydrolase [Fimbriimonadaceae bacterium]|nr:alpha/beta hydrolase [Fimbriimonadaceae bacterium]
MLTAILLLAMARPGVENDIVYTRAGGEQVKMDIYSPAGATASSKLPAVVVIHGGAWISGKREDMTVMAKNLADNGFVAANISYRLAPKHKYPAMLDDVQTAVRFLRENATKYGIDPKRIGAAGASAGGHLSLLLGSMDTRDPKPAEYPNQSSRVQVVWNLFGPVDMTLPFPQNVDVVFQMVLGKKREDASKELKEASPLTYINKNTCPVFTIQGLADPLVNPQHARVLDEALKKAGVEHKTVFIEGMGHEFRIEKPEVMSAATDAIEFLKKNLGLKTKPAARGGKQAA